MSVDIKAKNKGIDDYSSSYWNWRPIVCFMQMAIDKAGLNINTEKWQYNDNAGLDDQFQCTALAEAVWKIIIEKELTDDDDVYAVYGGWRTDNGGLLEVDKVIDLNNQYPIGTILYSSIILSDGRRVISAHDVPVFEIKNFVRFLRKCGGFEIH